MIPRLSAFGRRLRAVRERLGVDQTTFGEMGGVSRGAQSNYEKAARAPDVEYLLRIEEQGVDIAYLLTGHRNEELLDEATTQLANQLAGLPPVLRNPLCAYLDTLQKLIDNDRGGYFDKLIESYPSVSRSPEENAAEKQRMAKSMKEAAHRRLGSEALHSPDEEYRGEDQHDGK